MIKNRMPLTNLLTGILLAFAFAGGCLAFGLSREGRFNDIPIYVIIGLVAFGFILLLSILGIWKRQDWARKTLLIILYLGIFGWAILVFFWMKSMIVRRDWIEQMLPFIFSVFIYSILFGGIFYLKNKKFMDEFD